MIQGLSYIIYSVCLNVHVCFARMTSRSTAKSRCGEFEGRQIYKCGLNSKLTRIMGAYSLWAGLLGGGKWKSYKVNVLNKIVFLIISGRKGDRV